MALLEVKDLDVFYGKAQALNKISLNVEEGECVGVIGPNGAGKTTLLDSIVGLTDWHGKIILDNVDLSKVTPTDIIKMKIGYAPEREKIFPYMNVKENLLVGAYHARDRANENLKEVFKLFPILEKRQNQVARTLSGGEQQMLALGKALMSNPRLLLLDEPTFGLAPTVRRNISDFIDELKKKRISILIAEQNVVFTLAHSERIYVLEAGKITMKGSSRELKSYEYVRKSYFGL